MLLSDNETKVDMLNNMAIAKTIASIIRDCDERPISIGVHGDWGAGKSSILEMVESEFSANDDGIVCIKFNGWRHQGFEDAKTALMSSIISELEKNQKIADKAKETLSKLWKNINWLSVAKAAGGAIFSLATGFTPAGLLIASIDSVKSAVADKGSAEATIETAGQFLKDAKVFENNNSVSSVFSEFQMNFDELLKKSEIKRLVVLIDDLDRCLPKVTIETLEAVRLFMFTKSTAFVIAADEAMIEYAVHEHFPNLPSKDETEANKTEYDYSKRYLEKLIQVPFKIPALGRVESEMYITLLMIGSQVRDDDDKYKALLVTSLEKMKKPWENTGLGIDDLKDVLGDQYDTVSAEIDVATQISEILANNTQGNPRNIKRFLNMLLLRKQMATARGFGEAVQLPILAKLMLAEYYFSTEYASIALSLNDDDGKCSLLDSFEKKMSDTQEPANSKDEAGEELVGTGNAATPAAEETSDDKTTAEWSKKTAFKKWALNQPLLGDVDLRPYFFACKEREDFFFERIKSEQRLELISKLMGKSFNVISATEEIKALTGDEPKKAFNILTKKIKKISDISSEPAGIVGIRALVANHPPLENSLLSLIESFDCETVGTWIIKGWDDSITSDQGKARLKTYLDKLAKDGSTITKAAIKATAK